MRIVTDKLVRAAGFVFLAGPLVALPTDLRAEDSDGQVLRQQSPAEKRRALEDAEAKRTFFEHGAAGVDRQGTGTLRGARYQGDLKQTFSDRDTALGALGRAGRGESPLSTDDEHRATLEIMKKVHEPGAQ